MIERAEILTLIPHAGSMCLLDEVLDWNDQGVTCRSRSHLDPKNPLRGAHGLEALHLIEYAAQATAVHGGLRDRAQGRGPASGLLSSAREVKLHAQALHDIGQPLLVSARLRLADAVGWLYGFEISAGDRPLASGRLTVMLLRA